MYKSLRALIESALHRRSLRRWQQLADGAVSLSGEALRLNRQRGRQLRRHIDRLTHLAELHLALPMIGSNVILSPHGTDWAYRPGLWAGPLPEPGRSAVPNKAQIGPEAIVFHDCRVSELTFRQIRNTRESDLAPFGLRLDVFRFDGSFLSLAIDLPSEAAQTTRLKHIIRVNAAVEMEKPLEIFARLNIKHGPNLEQIVQEFPLGGLEVVTEFDLAYSKINEKRIEKMWLDLIFEGPEMNQIILRDVTISRRPRAEL